MPTVKLGKVATFVNGKAFKPSDWSTKGKKIIRIQNLTSDESEYNYFSGNIEDKYLVKKGDVLISWSASIGVYEWEHEEAVLNQHIFKVVFDKYEFDKRFFKYMMENKIREMISKSHGSTMKHITKKEFDNIDVDYINIEKQREIANKLDTISNLIKSKYNDLIDFNNLINSKLNELFVSDADYIRLKDVVKFINGDRGKNYPSSSDIKKEGEIPFINAGLVNKEGLDWKNMNYISKRSYERLSSGKIVKNDILYCLRGSLGKHGMIDFEGDGAIASSLVIMRADEEKILPKYLFFMLDTDDVLIQLERVKNGSTQPNSSATSVKEFKIKYPSLEKQKMFVEFVEKIEELKIIAEHDIEDLQKILEEKESTIFG